MGNLVTSTVNSYKGESKEHNIRMIPFAKGNPKSST